MNISLLLLSLFLTADKPVLNMDFGKKSAGQDWVIINDDVMGGRSNATLQLSKNSMLFKGNLSLENNGGFASVRSNRSTYNLAKAKTVTIRYRSSGRKFALMLENARMYFMPYYKHAFQSDSKEWQTETFQLSEFQGYRLGRPTGRNLDKDIQENILRIGVILNDKQEGPFELEIDYINFQ